MPKGWIAIFKPGTHTDAAGNTNTWTEEDVKAMADAYNNQPEDKRHDAPIVKGHPKNDDPALGWVDKLKYEGGKLLAKLKQVDKNFVEEVRKGLYKKISVRLYPDGKLLRHVGFLGAVPPAIKGLGDAELSEYPQFNDTEENNLNEDFIEIESSFADGDTVESLKISQAERSQKFGIGIKVGKGLITKPEHYSKLKDEDFGDPVHYRFPIHDAANTIVSMTMFNRYDTRNEYEESERQIIGARIVEAAMKFKVNDKDAEIFRNMFNDKLQITNKSEEIKVDEKTKAMRDSFFAKLKDSTSEEIASIASKIFEEVFSPVPEDKKSMKKSESNDSSTKNFEDSDAFKKLQEDSQKLLKDNQELKDKLRKKEFMEFLESDQIKTKVPPAQRPSALDMLEMAYQSGSEFTDSDGNKINAVDKIKNYFLSLPDIVSLQNLPSSGIQTGNDFAEEDKEIESYNKNRGR